MPTSGSVCVTVDETSVRVIMTVVPDVHPVSVSVSVVVMVAMPTTTAMCF